MLFLQGYIGLALVRHYCGERLAGQHIGMFTAEASCGMEKKAASQQSPPCEKPARVQEKDCCHDEVERVQVEDDRLKAPSLASPNLVVVVLVALSFVFGSFRLANVASEVALSGYPPPLRFTHRRFRAFLQIFRN